MATKKKNDQYDSILNKLGFDANELIVDQNNQYQFNYIYFNKSPHGALHV